MPVSKKKVIKSLDRLSEDLKDLMKVQYPTGYENSITRINNAKKEPIFVFPLETDEATYLVKLPATKNSEGGYDLDAKPKEDEFERGEKGADDEFAGGADDFAGGGDDYDAAGSDDSGDDSNKEASYDPDFDN